MGDEPIPQRRAGERAASGSPTLGDVLDLLGGMELRVTGAVGELREDFEVFVQGHAREHEAHGVWSQEKYAEIMGRFHSADIEAAKRAGALGVLRFAMDLAGRNWKVIATLALAIMAALGNIRIEVLAQ
jgi:hypothetical protein